MGANVFKINGTGTAAIALYGAVPTQQHYRLVSVTTNFVAAPTTSENYTITLYPNAGGIYSILFYTVDPSAGATVNILWQPDEEIILEGGDQIAVEFANTDTVNYGAQITFKAV